MGIRLTKENPLTYEDVDTHADVPVREYLDVASGQKVKIVFHKNHVRVVYIPAGLVKKTAWRTILGISTDIRDMVQSITTSQKQHIEDETTPQIGAP